MLAEPKIAGPPVGSHREDFFQFFLIFSILSPRFQFLICLILVLLLLGGVVCSWCIWGFLGRDVGIFCCGDFLSCYWVNEDFSWIFFFCVWDVYMGVYIHPLWLLGGEDFYVGE